jgi:hypothetical protein
MLVERTQREKQPMLWIVPAKTSAFASATSAASSAPRHSQLMLWPAQLRGELQFYFGAEFQHLRGGDQELIGRKDARGETLRRAPSVTGRERIKPLLPDRHVRPERGNHHEGAQAPGVVQKQPAADRESRSQAVIQEVQHPPGNNHVVHMLLSGQEPHGRAIPSSSNRCSTLRKSGTPMAAYEDKYGR